MSEDLNEYKVALKCGPTDYHFIRLDAAGWYNKSGNLPGTYVDQSVVLGDVWYVYWDDNGKTRIGYPENGFDVYDYEDTIFFAVKEGWAR